MHRSHIPGLFCEDFTVGNLQRSGMGMEVPFMLPISPSLIILRRKDSILLLVGAEKEGRLMYFLPVSHLFAQWQFEKNFGAPADGFLSVIYSAST